MENSQNDGNNTLSENTIIDEYGNKYEGEIKNGQANGKGVKTYKDGRVYKGLFKDNKRHGEGILYRPDGTIFKGFYKNDAQDGLGINITKEGNELKAFFNEGKCIKGKGIMYYNEENSQDMKFTNRYIGSYQNNKMEGYGIFTMANGDRYEGEFQKDYFNGRGVYYFSDGIKYEGKFKNNKKEGRGKLSFNNGQVLDCIWKDDFPFVFEN